MMSGSICGRFTYEMKCGRNLQMRERILLCFVPTGKNKSNSGRVDYLLNVHYFLNTLIHFNICFNSLSL